MFKFELSMYENGLTWLPKGSEKLLKVGKIKEVQNGYGVATLLGDLQQKKPLQISSVKNMARHF